MMSDCGCLASVDLEPWLEARWVKDKCERQWIDCLLYTERGFGHRVEWRALWRDQRTVNESYKVAEGFCRSRSVE